MSIIIKPIVTEKVTKESEVSNRFGFVVDKKANKVQIKKAVEAAYGVLNAKSLVLLEGSLEGIEENLSK